MYSMQELINFCAKEINTMAPQEAVHAHHLFVQVIYDEYRDNLEDEAKKLMLKYISNALFDERLVLRRKDNEVLRKL